MSMLHYVTFKYVVIKDKRLGVAYYCLAAVIVLYTLVQIVINKAYLEVGNFFFTLVRFYERLFWCNFLLWTI